MVLDWRIRGAKESFLAFGDAGHLIFPQYSHCAKDMKLHIDFGDNKANAPVSGMTDDSAGTSSYSEYSTSRSMFHES